MPSKPRARKAARTVRSVAVAARTKHSKVVTKRPGRTARAGLNPIHALDPIITMNAGGVIQSASESVERVFGWTPTELFGRNVKLLIPEPRRSVLDQYLDRYRHAGNVSVLKRARRFDAVRKDGTIFQIELSVSRADLPASLAPFFIGIVRDVSQQIDVGPGSVEERTHLEQLLAEQARALATANLRIHLADRLAALGTLAAGLGHDMNHVLLPVRARLNALEHSGITAAALAHLKAIRASVAYLQHLSDGLHFLALDPHQTATDRHNTATTDINHWWKQVGPLLRKAIPKRIDLKVSLPTRLPLVRIAPHWLTHAVLNLIVNAGESIPEKRRHARVSLWATVTADGRTVKLGVTDNGRGMAAGIQRRAFDIFFTTKARTLGTGLGLPLARKVATRAGGDIELESEAGRGTSVVMSLQAAPRSTPASQRNGKGQLMAAVSVSDHRASALITQILASTGVQICPVSANGPGKADIWITQPTARALSSAGRWRKRRHKGLRTLVLLGRPPKLASAKWAALGATIIDPPGHFEGMRHTLGEVLEEYK